MTTPTTPEIPELKWFEEWVDAQTRKPTALEAEDYEAMYKVIELARSALTRPTPPADAMMTGELYERLYQENKAMRDDLDRLNSVRNQQKREAGFNANDSFDVVWKEMLSVWNDREVTNTQEMRQKILCEIDTGADYLVARKKVAELSGLGVMAHTFDGHIEAIKAALHPTPVTDAQRKALEALDYTVETWSDNFGFSPKHVQNFFDEHHETIRAALSAPVAQMDHLVDALKKCRAELLLIKDDAFCDHTVGICSCGYWAAVEAATKALAHYHLTPKTPDKTDFIIGMEGRCKTTQESE